MNTDSIEKVCVVGFGKTGVSLCNLLLSLKKEVKVTETRESSRFDSALIDGFRKKGVAFEFEGHTEDFIRDCELLILSPGVDALHSPIVKSANAQGVLQVGEIEFCFWLTKAKFIAITGTNGKTTTSHLTYEVLKQKRKKVFLGGNIGIPLSSFILDTKKGDYIVLEISSFQLETIIEFRPYIAVFLNVEPDHLDRYSDFKEYLKAKLNIFKNQRSSDWALLNKNISFRNFIEKKIVSKIVYFLKEFPNENFSCVYRIVSILGLSKADCMSVFSSFKGLSHRLEVVRRFKGITFINDSKATNISSTIWALGNIKGPIILLAGGKDKGLDYSPILKYMGRIKKINLFGEAKFKIKESLNSRVNLELFTSLKELVMASFKEAKPGYTILFSPMCSSFDMFYDYQERGDKFIEIVNSL